jgi:microcystin-dependent protein
VTIPTPYNYAEVQAAAAAAAVAAAAAGLDNTDQTTPSQATESDENTYRWSTVTQLSPLRIQLDGETVPMPITPERLVDSDNLRVGTRVWVQFFGRRVIILGASQGGADVYAPIGAMMPYAGSTPPSSNWLFANGATASRTVYATLFAVCGTTYGNGDGSTTFNLPNYQDRVPVGSGATYTRGATGGAATVALSAAELPSHQHTFSASLVSGSAASVGDHSHGLSGSTSSDGTHTHGYVNASSTRSDMNASAGSTCNNGSFSSDTGGAGGHGHSLSGSTTSDGGHSHSVSGNVSGNTGSIGSGTAHQNLQPYLAVPYIIRAL